jgi:putative transposase
MERDITHTELYVHVIMAVSTRKCLIKPAWESQLYEHLCDRIAARRSAALAIGGADDHVHILLSLSPQLKLDELIRDIKRSSNEFINAGGFLRSYFSWQENYGAFSCGREDIASVKRFIGDQKLIHKRITFKEEFLQLLKENAVEADGRKAFVWVNEGLEQISS